MAVIKVERLRGSEASYASPNANTYSDTYRIYCDSDMARYQVLLGAQTGGLPQLLDAHAEFDVVDASSYCQSIQLAQLAQHKRTWTATVEYGPMKPNQQTGDNVANPLLRPVKFHVEWIEENEAVVKDISGNPITNAVGDEFDTPLELPRLYPVLVVEKPYANMQDMINVGITYHRSVNSKTFFGGAPRTVKFLPIQSQPVQLENGIEYYLASLRFAFNPSTWDVEILNRGWRVRPAAGAAPIKAIDKETQLPVSTPVNLAADGTLLPEGAAKDYVKRQIYTLKDYTLIF